MTDKNDWIDPDAIEDEFCGWKADEARRLHISRDRDAAKLALWAEMRSALKLGLARIESDIESPGRKVYDGTAIRKVLAKCDALDPPTGVS